MNISGKVALVVCVVGCGTLPAWANNPPQPDGLFSVLLIFPLAILGFKLAGVTVGAHKSKWRWLRSLVFVPVVLFLLVGDFCRCRFSSSCWFMDAGADRKSCSKETDGNDNSWAVLSSCGLFSLWATTGRP